MIYGRGHGDGRTIEAIPACSVQSRHESESVDEGSFDSNREMTSDRVRMAQLLDCNRLEFQVVAKEMFLAITSSVFVLEIPNERRLW